MRNDILDACIIASCAGVHPMDVYAGVTIMNNIRYGPKITEPLTKEEKQFIDWIVKKIVEKRGGR